MATKKKMFSYDDEYDHDIQQYFDSLPSKKHSAYIRQGLRLLIQLQTQGQPVTMFPVVGAFGQWQQPGQETIVDQIQEVEDQDDDMFEDIDDAMFGFGADDEEEE